MNATIYALAILGAIFLTFLGVGFFFILLSTFLDHKQDGPRPPYEGDAGDEVQQGRALYGEPAVWPRNFDEWLVMVDQDMTHRRVNIHNN